MKKLLTILLLLILWLPVSSQEVTLTDTKVEVRDDRGNLIASNYFAGVEQAMGCYGIVTLKYENGKVEVRDPKLNLEVSNYYTDLLGVAISGPPKDPRITFYYKGKKIEVRNRKLELVSTRYRQ